MTTPTFARFELVRGGAMHIPVVDVVRISPVYHGVFGDGALVAGQSWVWVKAEAFQVVGDPDDVIRALGG